MTQGTVLRPACPHTCWQMRVAVDTAQRPAGYEPVCVTHTHCRDTRAQSPINHPRRVQVLPEGLTSAPPGPGTMAGAAGRHMLSVSGLESLGLLAAAARVPPPQQQHEPSLAGSNAAAQLQELLGGSAGGASWQIAQLLQQLQQGAPSVGQQGVLGAGGPLASFDLSMLQHGRLAGLQALLDGSSKSLLLHMVPPRAFAVWRRMQNAQADMRIEVRPAPGRRARMHTLSVRQARGREIQCTCECARAPLHAARLLLGAPCIIII